MDWIGIENKKERRTLEKDENEKERERESECV